MLNRVPRSVRSLAPLVALLFALAILLLPREAIAHGMRSAYLEVQETTAGNGVLRFRMAIAARDVGPILPRSCSLTREGRTLATDAGDVQSFSLHCTEPLSGAEIGVSGLGPIISEAVIWVTLSDGTSATAVVTPERPTWTIPKRAGPLTRAGQYVELGVRHIATGIDHLLFLALLVLSLRKLRPILLAETAFSLSHTVSFAATATGAVTVNSAVAEACIALSLLLLARDLVDRDASPPLADGAMPIFSARQGALLALVFGLVHGLGFAGGLKEVGIPDVHAAWALTGFGLGVEFGQLGFVLALLAIGRLAARAPSHRRWESALVYGTGLLAGYWTVERTWMALVSG